MCQKSAVSDLLLPSLLVRAHRKFPSIMVYVFAKTAQPHTNKNVNDGHILKYK